MPACTLTFCLKRLKQMKTCLSLRDDVIAPQSSQPLLGLSDAYMCCAREISSEICRSLVTALRHAIIARSRWEALTSSVVQRMAVAR